MKLSMKEKKFVLCTAVAALFFGIAPAANAMHIMEGYLPPKFCIAWGVICIPFWSQDICQLKRPLQKAANPS